MNKKLIVALIVIVVIGGGVWAYVATRPNASAPQSNSSNGGSDDNSNSSSQSSESSSTETPAATTELLYTDSGFSPTSLTAKVGTSIRIVNQSSGPLQFSSDDHPTHTKHAEFNLSTIAAGGEETLELKTAGTWGYHNHLKAGDEGTITVTE